MRHIFINCPQRTVRQHLNVPIEMRHSPDFKRILWWGNRLADVIKHSDYRPDIVVGIANKGLVPAKIIADSLGVRLHSIKISRVAEQDILTEEDVDNKYKNLPKVLSVPNFRFNKDSCILIADESINTGGSVIAAARMLASTGASQSLMRIAALADIQVPKIADFWVLNSDSKWYGGHFCSAQVDRDYMEWMSQHFPGIKVEPKEKF